MPSFKQHCNDCQQILGDRCAEVNHWMDAMHSEHGVMHRHVRHHWGGVEQAEKLFGSMGRKAALIHILKDCGRIPTARDYEGSDERVIRLNIAGGPNPDAGSRRIRDQKTFIREAAKLLAKDEQRTNVNKYSSDSRIVRLVRLLGLKNS